MEYLVSNNNFSVSLSLTLLKIMGFWMPENMSNGDEIIYKIYAVVMFMFLLGTYLIIQVVDMFLIWGNLPLMTGTAFLLFTNLAQAAKIISLVARRHRIGHIIREANAVMNRQVDGDSLKIVKRCNKETKFQQILYFCLTTITVAGWAGSAEKNQLPLRAWYPYNTTKSPAFELTYFHQISALFICAYLNVAKDSLVASLIAQTRCRLQLLNLALEKITEDFNIDPKTLVLTQSQEKEVAARLRSCFLQHQAALDAASELQQSFSVPTFMQFSVSMVIICVTAFQLASQTGNLIRFLSMGTYLLNMMLQVFIYCYQGNALKEESASVCGGAYSCDWVACSPRVRRLLLVLMTRTKRPVSLSAAGFTPLSLQTFTAIIKASYSFFTVLQQVEEK